MPCGCLWDRPSGSLPRCPCCPAAPAAAAAGVGAGTPPPLPPTLTNCMQIVVQSSQHSPARRIARPATAYFKGSIASAPGSSVLLSVHPNGAVHGLAYRGNASFILARSGGPEASASSPAAAAAALAAAPLSSRRATSAQMRALPRFGCGVQRRPVPAGSLPSAGMGTRRLSQVCAWPAALCSWPPISPLGCAAQPSSAVASCN